MNYNTTNNNLEKPRQNWDHADWWNRTHFSCNGDPTLRLYQLQPPSSPAINLVNSQAILSWTVSPDAQTTGYHVYQSTSEFGIYTRLTSAAVTMPNYTIANYSNDNWYMVRAVKPQESGCGTFMHPSAGIFVQGNLPLSVAENGTIADLKVFPNPVSGQLTISGKGIQSVRILTADGREVLKRDCATSDEVKVDLSGLSAGIYMIEAGDGKAAEMRRIVVE